MVSKLNVEYVVNPPITPVVSARRSVGGSTAPSRPRYITTATRNDPITFTASVPYGNAGPNISSAQPDTTYRAPVPNAPPRQIHRNRTSDLLSERRAIFGTTPTALSSSVRRSHWQRDQRSSLRFRRTPPPLNVLKLHEVGAHEQRERRSHRRNRTRAAAGDGCRLRTDPRVRWL